MTTFDEARGPRGLRVFPPRAGGGPAWFVSKGTRVVLVQAFEEDTALAVGALRLAGVTPQSIGRKIGWDRFELRGVFDGVTIRRAGAEETEQMQLVLEQLAAGREGCRVVSEQDWSEPPLVGS